jgi:hypothetical protein
MQTSIINEWKTNIKLGVVNPKVQAMKSDNAEVPGYLWCITPLEWTVVSLIKGVYVFVVNMGVYEVIHIWCV